MIKTSLIVVAGVTIASGCAFVDNPQKEAANTAQSATVASESAGAISESEVAIAKPTPAVIVRSPTTDDIRRMQLRLREVGLDPGAVDGIAGAKTKAAFKRFQTGCAELENLLNGSQNLRFDGVPLDKTPNRQETLAIQSQLRRAGFNPGPADGLFGARMKTTLTHLQNGCPVTQEFAAQLDRPADSTGKPTAAGNLPERPSAPRIIAAQSRQEAAKPLTAAVSVRPQEEIRILQLRLRDAGYDPGPFDGVMGPKTKLALQQMQARQRSGKTKNTVTAGIGTQY